MFPAIAILTALLMGLLSCQGGPAGTTEVTSGRDPDSSVSGTVTYRERIALTPGARVIVELRDTSYADAAAPLVASQTITDPGQVPVRFNVPYNRDDIDPRNTYSVSARIIESDGRLAFINDTAYDVITRGGPSRVEMMLVLVEPPPEMLADSDQPDQDWRQWVEVPARVTNAGLIPNEDPPHLRIQFLQPTGEGCARRGSASGELSGAELIAKVTLMQRPETPWAVPCDEDLVELDEIVPVLAPLDPGTTYRVVVNGRPVGAFTPPPARLGHTHTVESPVRDAVIEQAEGGYVLRAITGRPSGSCTRYNGYEVQVREPGIIEVSITHHQVSNPEALCTRDFPVDETVAPLQFDLTSGAEYTVLVNGEEAGTFVAP